MWSQHLVFAGTDLYHLIACFVIYSIGGWVIESIYMSFCNKKLTNRGFGFLPFCPIYGFGGVLGYLILCPLADAPVLLYLTGAVVATVFEFLVAMLMLKMFNLVWWDYNDKPFNYKGVICLESTLAWGVYAIVIVRYLHRFLLTQIDRVPVRTGKIICVTILIVYGIDFLYHLLLAFGVNVKKYKEQIAGTVTSAIRRD